MYPVKMKVSKYCTALWILSRLPACGVKDYAISFVRNGALVAHANFFHDAARGAIFCNGDGHNSRMHMMVNDDA